VIAVKENDMKTFEPIGTDLERPRPLQNRKRVFFSHTIGWIIYILIFGTLPISAQVPTFKHIYIFGDSLSDTGNFFKANGGTRPASLPYYSGRFSNGPLWEEYLAEWFLVPTTQLNNFAMAGASSGLYSSYVTDPQSPLYRTGLLSQVRQFIADNTATEPEDLFIIWAGLNDYAGKAQQPTSEVIDNITAAVRQLVGSGAENILIVNLPDLGALPAAKSHGNLSPTLTKVTIAHNQALALAVESLTAALHPANVTLYDVYSKLEKVIHDPERFAIVDVQDSCISNTGYPFSPPSTIAFGCAATPNEYFFWDSIHPTTAAHRLIAEGAYSALGGDVDFRIASSEDNRERITPGAVITIEISGFADSAASVPGPPYPRFLGASSVQIDGLYAPLLYVAPTEVTAQVPCNVSPGPAVVTVTTASGATSKVVIVYRQERTRYRWSVEGESCHDVNATSTE
jgi:phospholipase/lecithinase/hemolysin